jgi:hypothetical protein
MKLDIRYPIGCLFLIIGGLLAAYGVWRHQGIDLWWGLVQVAFGAVMFGLARSGSSAKTGEG